MNKTIATIGAVGLVGIGVVTGNALANTPEYKKVDDTTVEITKSQKVRFDIESLNKDLDDVTAAKLATQISCQSRIKEFDSSIDSLLSDIAGAKGVGVEKPLPSEQPTDVEPINP